jgi:hypothetical protein
MSDNTVQEDKPIWLVRTSTGRAIRPGALLHNVTDGSRWVFEALASPPSRNRAAQILAHPRDYPDEARQFPAFYLDLEVQEQ